MKQKSRENMILDTIVSAKREELKAQKELVPEKILDKKLSDLKIKENERWFFNAIRRDDTGNIKIIAEIKKASPSRGIIRQNFDYDQIAKIYAGLNVDAISVLTEKQFFQGSLEYLSALSKEITIPLLRKDFIMDEYQIKESAVNGASALLLIASILELSDLKKYITLCDSLNIGCIVEVHDEQDLERALKAQPVVIGINNRDLQTFTVDITTTERLMRRIPENTVIVSESGIHTPDNVRYLNDLGVDAVLVGEALMKETDISKKFYELFGSFRKGVQ